MHSAAEAIEWLMSHGGTLTVSAESGCVDVLMAVMMADADLVFVRYAMDSRQFCDKTGDEADKWLARIANELRDKINAKVS